MTTARDDNKGTARPQALRTHAAHSRASSALVTSLRARLESDQFDERQHPDSRFVVGWNAALRHVLALLDVEGGLAELVANTAERVDFDEGDTQPWPIDIDNKFDHGGEA